MRRGLRLGLEMTGLALVLAFVASVAYLPHADSFTQPPEGDKPQLVQLGLVYWSWLVEHRTDDYEYTVHVDENMHWARMANIERAQSLRFTGAFGGLPEEATPLHLRELVHERGFYVAQVHLHQLTGLEWIDILRFLPAIWAATTASLVYAALRPSNAAWIAAALVALIPTSPRFLGPGFLVPIGFGLAWIAAMLVIGPTAAKRGRGFALVLVIVVWAFFIHLIAGFAALGVVLALLPLHRRNIQALAALVATALLPIVTLLTVFREGVDTEIERVGELPIDLSIFDQLGIPILLVWGLGSALVALKPPQEKRDLLVAATLASVVALGFIVTAIVSRSGAYAIYDRWHQPFALFAVFPIAYAVTLVASALVEAAGDLAQRTPRLRRRPWPAGALSASAAAIFAILAIGPGIGHHLDEPYYHVLQDEDWADFVWVSENVNATHEIFLAHPWKAPILNAMSGLEPRAYLEPGTPPINGADWAAYRRGALRGADLVDREVSLVVDNETVEIDGFVALRPRVAQLEWEQARELAALRHARPEDAAASGAT